MLYIKREIDMKNRTKIALLCIMALLLTLSFAIAVFAADATTEAQNLLSEIAETPPTLSADGKSVVLPSISNDGYTVSIYGTSNSSVIDIDGNVYTPLVDTEVSLMYKVSSTTDETDFAIDQYKEAKIMIEGQYQTSASDNAEPAVLPKLREWKGATGFVQITENSRIVVTNPDFADIAARAKEYLDAITGFDMEIVTSSAAAGDIILSYTSAAELGSEGYTIDLDDRVTIAAYGEIGALYGATTIAQMLDVYDGYNLPCGHVRDYPQYPVRAMMLDVARHYVPMEYLTEITKYMAYFKINTMRVHINDTGGQQPYAFRVESKKFPEINANLGENYYTQDEYRAYQREMLSYGIKVITEIDSPGHAGFVGAYDSSLLAVVDGNTSSLLNLSTDVHSTVDGVDYTYYDKSVEFMKSLYDEFIGGDNPVVINEIDTFHIGMDEYTLDHEQFKVYMKEMADYVKSLGKKPQVWSALKASDFETEPPIGKDITVNYWGAASFKDLIDYGYPCVSNNAMLLYVVPGGFSNSFGDRLNIEALYETYSVHQIYYNITLSPSSPLLLGVEASLWNDTNVAVSLQDIFDRFHDQMLLVSEKSWYGPNAEGATAEEFMARVHKFENSVPLVNPSRFVEGDENGNVAKYDFENLEDGIVKDNLGQYDAAINGLSTVNVNGNTMLALDGNGYLSLPFDTLGNPYTVSFDLMYEGSENGILFGNEGSWLMVNHNGTGKIAYKRDLQTFTLPYVFLEGITYNVKLVCDDFDVYLYVNGIFACKGEIYSMDTVHKNTNYIAFTTLSLPTAEIGKGVTGILDNLTISNVAEDYNDLTGLNIVNYSNVALGKDVTCSGVETTEKWGPECAVDGILKADDNNNKTSLNNADNSWLQIDLGKVYEVEKIVIEFYERPESYQFLTSTNGVDWETVYTETEEYAGQSSGTDTVMLYNKEVRYVKYVTLKCFFSRYNYSGSFHEIMVYSSAYDKTVLERAKTLLESLSGNNKAFLEDSIELTEYVIANNDYNDAGVALKSLVNVCDMLESGINATTTDRSELISLATNKKAPEIYSADSYNAYNEAYKFVLGEALNPNASAALAEHYAAELETAALELTCTATIETDMDFDNPANLLDGTDSHAVTTSNQVAGNYITVKFESGIELKSLKLVMYGSGKYLGVSTVYVSYNGTDFVPVTTLNQSLAESNITISATSKTGDNDEIFFPKALRGVKAIKLVVNADTANVAYINEIHINHVTNFNTIAPELEGLKEEDYTAASVKNLLPFTRGMAVGEIYMCHRFPVYVKYLVKRADVDAIEAEIARLEAIIADGYTTESYARLTAAIEAARAFISSVTTNTDIYDGEAEIEKLRKAEGMLLLKNDAIDTSALEAALRVSVDAKKYTYFSYNAYAEAKAAATELLYSGAFTEEEINKALSALNEKYNELKPRSSDVNVAYNLDVENIKVSGYEAEGAASANEANLVDGVTGLSMGNRFCLNNADDAFIQLDLGGIYVIDRVSLYWYRQPAKYSILVSADGLEWTTVYTTLHNEKMNSATTDHIYFDAIEAQYVKYQQIMQHVGNVENGYRYSGNINEFEVYGVDIATYKAEKLQYHYDSLVGIDSNLLHADCAAEHLAAIAEAERVLALDTPTEAEIDAALALLKAHSPLSYTTVNGQLTFTCECGRSETKQPIVLNAAKLNLNENINMIYLFTVNGSVESIRVDFTFKGKVYATSDYTVEADGRYAFRFENILPQYMNDRLSATVYARIDGMDVTLDCGGISVKEYAEKLLKLYPTNAKLVTLISDLLIYGDAAQNYTSYNTGNLASSGLDLTPSEFTAPASKLSVNENSPLTAVVSAGLKLTGDVNMYFTFSATDTEGLYAKITINGREVLYDVSALTPEANGNYRIYFNKVMAHELDDTVTLTFIKDGSDIGNTLTYSVNSYIAAVYTSSNTALASLVKALCCYGASAKAYLG